jgi:hypothetical protein
MGLVLSLILMLVYYLAFIGGTRIANNAQFSPFLGAWLPNLGFAALAMFLFIRSDHAYENRALVQLASAIDWISDRVAAIRCCSSLCHFSLLSRCSNSFPTS